MTTSHPPAPPWDTCLIQAVSTNADSQFPNNSVLPWRRGALSEKRVWCQQENNTVTEVTLGARPETATRPISFPVPGRFLVTLLKCLVTQRLVYNWKKSAFSLRLKKTSRLRLRAGESVMETKRLERENCTYPAVVDVITAYHIASGMLENCVFSDNSAK